LSTFELHVRKKIERGRDNKFELHVRKKIERGRDNKFELHVRKKIQRGRDKFSLSATADTLPTRAEHFFRTRNRFCNPGHS